jgi:putative spermidine/putrescine transport system substrate-binding protein
MGVFTVVLLFAAACASDSDENASDRGSASSGKIDGGGDTFVYNTANASAQFTDALEASFVSAFEEQYNFETITDPFCCGIEKLRAAQNANNVPWDVVQWVTHSDFELAKEAGLLEPLDTDVVPVERLEEGTYDEYGYQLYTTGVILGWLPDTYPEGEEPTQLEDIFDTERFPGKRCVYESPQFGGTLEAALLSAGVPPDELYPIDFDLAFEQLDKIKSDIVWWSEGAEAAQNLLDGTCQLGMIWNGVAQSTAASGNELEVAWGNTITLHAINSIPKGSPHAEAAQEFLGFMLTDEDAYVEFLSKTAYTTPLQDPPELPEDVARWAPQGENLESAIPEDWEYYAENRDEITKTFNDWLVTGK